MCRPRIAVIPAAGKAERLPRALRPKELLPIAPAAARGISPRVISEFVLDAVRIAGVRHACIVVSPEKQQVADFFGSGSDRGLRISYAVFCLKKKKAHAIDAAYSVVRGATVLMGMPDTL